MQVTLVITLYLFSVFLIASASAVVWGRTDVPTQTVVCSTGSCKSDAVLSTANQVWAPGMSISRKLIVVNESASRLSISVKPAEIHFAGLEPEFFSMTWKNGSHRLIWQGNLSDTDSAIGLATVPPHSRRIFYYTATLSEALTDAQEHASVWLKWQISIEDMVSGDSSAKGVSKSSLANALAQPPLIYFGKALGFTLPGLSLARAAAHSPATSNTPVKTVVTMIQRIWWAPYVILALQVLALRPWKFGDRRPVEALLLSSCGCVAVWIVSGSWPLAGMSAIVPVIWLVAGYLAPAQSNTAATE